MTSRERLRAVLAHRVPDRVPLADIACAPWPETLRRWHAEGLPEGCDPREWLGMDRVELFGFDGSLRLAPEVLEQNARWRIYRNADGILLKEWMPDAGEFSPAVHVGCTIKDREAWNGVRCRLAADPVRLPPEAVAQGLAWNRADAFVALTPIEPAWFLLEMLTGFEEGLPLLAEEPDLAYDIMADYTDFTLAMCDLCLRSGVRFDALWFFSDLCYKNGMLFSPAAYRRLIRPHHERFRDWCAAHGLPMMLHCDGDVRQFIPELIDVGFDAIQPLEARCGNDVRDLKRRHGTDIVLYGNVSADVLAEGTDEEVEHEVRSKVGAAREGGGYIYHVDHSIPPTIGLARYKRVVEMAREAGSYA